MKNFYFPIWLTFLLFSCKNDEGSVVNDFVFAQFEIENNNCLAPCEVRFINSSTNAESYSWNFGDGNTRSEENPNHTYQNPGNYTTILTAINENGHQDTVSRIINITETSSPSLDFVTGMDLSYQPFLEKFGTQFYEENGTEINDFYQFVKNNGVNLVRFRLFHNPVENEEVVYEGRLSQVLEECQKVKASGNNILLDFHYSDTWADPGKQFVPAAWDGKPFAEVQDSVYAYTKFVLEKMMAQNTLPDMIQIGNEINSGMLWDYGKVWGTFDNNWNNLAALITASNQAISEIEAVSGKDIQTMVHVAGAEAKAFYENIIAEGVDFDIIGLSYYSWWHGNDIQVLENKLIQLADVFQKPIIIVETSYPFTLEWNDWTDNVFGSEEHLIDGYPATPEGQKALYEKLVEILKTLPDNRGKGFVWWAPDYVAFNGAQSNEGSAFENLCMFDFEHRALPIFEVFQ